MSTVMTPNDSAQHAPHHRRSREEVEALAKNFVGAPAEDAPKSRIGLFGAVGGGLIAMALVVAVALPGRQAAEPARATADQSRAAAEAQAMRQRFEAERERKRKELAASTAYMEKMAAADAQLVKDMSAQAEMLATRVAAKPAAAESEPTPWDATAAKPTPAPAPATTTASAPAKPAPITTAAATQEPAKAQPAAATPTQVAQVDKSQCSIHVSELSKSGKLTYADVAKMKGARLDADTGHVFTPPVQAGGRTVVFEVMPTGCVRLTRR
jgi:uncharacterized membrane-anchored protein YhcB (DUF1043 family)